MVLGKANPISIYHHDNICVQQPIKVITIGRKANIRAKTAISVLFFSKMGMVMRCMALSVSASTTACT